MGDFELALDEPYRGHDGGQWPYNQADYDIGYDFDPYQDIVHNDGWHDMGDFELALDEPYRGGLL